MGKYHENNKNNKDKFIINLLIKKILNYFNKNNIVYKNLLKIQYKTFILIIFQIRNIFNNVLLIKIITPQRLIYLFIKNILINYYNTCSMIILNSRLCFQVAQYLVF